MENSLCIQQPSLRPLPFELLIVTVYVVELKIKAYKSENQWRCPVRYRGGCEKYSHDKWTFNKAMAIVAMSMSMWHIFKAKAMPYRAKIVLIHFSKSNKHLMLTITAKLMLRES